MAKRKSGASQNRCPPLIHWSKDPLFEVHSCAQINPKDKSYYSCFIKPQGLWVSIDRGGEGWAQWCRKENFRVADLRYRNAITVRNPRALLCLHTPRALDALTEEYGIDDPSFSSSPPSFRNWTRAINWHAVAEKYPGIIIPSYIGRRRLSLSWYYGWDCASGCIWDASQIIAIKRRRSRYGINT